ncbi:hypothetical protein [Desulfotomaculum copahuensis]|uniref:Uncharacterized protein n=1 Tax=Desulfotomaculum copahuensis TaxID=1838280 RepID=A0A1B7LCF2_9FIRM|nr:hypothetical protein [Desulfotomaculum copahuensis]OAT80376.1 hypothetical protein A6M21_13490 [Desulfotomaculum copahuensis]
MKIFLNESAVCDEDKPAAMSHLGTIMREIEQNNLVVRLFKIDGVDCEFTREGSVDACRDADLVELKICSLPELLREALDDAKEYLPRLSRGLRRAAEFFVTGLEGEGVNIFLQSLDGLGWFEQLNESLVSGIHAFLPEGFTDRLSGHRSSMADLLAAWENQDYLLVGDILDYELAPFLEYFTEQLPLLKELMSSEKNVIGDKS